MATCSLFISVERILGTHRAQILVSPVHEHAKQNAPRATLRHEFTFFCSHGVIWHNFGIISIRSLKHQAPPVSVLPRQCYQNFSSRSGLCRKREQTGDSSITLLMTCRVRETFLSSLRNLLTHIPVYWKTNFHCIFTLLKSSIKMFFEVQALRVFF